MHQLLLYLQVFHIEFDLQMLHGGSGCITEGVIRVPGHKNTGAGLHLVGHFIHLEVARPFRNKEHVIIRVAVGFHARIGAGVAFGNPQKLQTFQFCPFLQNQYICFYHSTY